MHRSAYYILLPLFFTILFSSCKTSKELKETRLERVSESEFQELLDKSNLSFTTLETRGTAQIKTDGFSMGGSYILRLKNDEVIWAVIKKFGLEVARLQVQNDTVTVLNRFEKVYWQFHESELEQIVKMDIDAKDLIQLLAGNSLYDEGEIKNISQDSTDISFASSHDDFMVNHTFSLWSNAIRKSRYSDQTLRMIDVEYSNFETINENPFAKKRIYTTEIKDMGRSKVEVKLNDIKVDEELTFPFEIPSHYTKAEY